MSSFNIIILYFREPTSNQYLVLEGKLENTLPSSDNPTQQQTSSSSQSSSTTFFWTLIRNPDSYTPPFYLVLSVLSGDREEVTPSEVFRSAVTAETAANISLLIRVSDTECLLLVFDLKILRTKPGRNFKFSHKVAQGVEPRLLKEFELLLFTPG